MKSSIYFHIILLGSLLCCISCSNNDTPVLPDLNRESFSYKEVMQKQKALQERVTNNKRDAI